MSRPKAEIIITGNAEAEGRGINKRLTSKSEQTVMALEEYKVATHIILT